ncbi:olfactory receptor 7C1-like [Discoglossus pictus]
MLIITVISMDCQLQTPMYFFLCSLSFADIFYTSVTLPKLMDILLTSNNRITFIACLAQSYFFTCIACTEIFLLTVMAYDRYVAICKPLHYPAIMNKRYCIILVVSSYILGHCNSVFVTVVASQISFCGANTISQLFCDIKSMLKISCGKIRTFLAMIYLETLTLGICPFLCILLSYIQIISSILKAYPTGKRNKAFSTCTSHLLVLVLFYGTIFCVYMTPPSVHSVKYEQMFSVIFIAVTPTINPLIYSLRNKDMQNALMQIAKGLQIRPLQ